MARIRLAALTALACAAVAAAGLPAPAGAASGLPRGHYQCYTYAGGYPSLAAGFWILDSKRYAYEGKRQKGTYKMGKKSNKGTRFTFKSGPYAGYWGYYRKVKGSPFIELHNELGIVGNGCPRISS